MEYAKDDLLKYSYNDIQDQVGEIEKKSNFFRKHKIMSVVIMACILLIVLNGVLIYEFFSILSTM